MWQQDGIALLRVARPKRWCIVAARFFPEIRVTP